MKDRIGIALTEASTWRGLILIATGLGVQLDPAQMDAIVAFGMAAAGLIGVFFRRATPPA